MLGYLTRASAARRKRCQNLKETRRRGDAGTRRRGIFMHGGEKIFSSGLPPAFCLLPPASCLLPHASCLQSVSNNTYYGRITTVGEIPNPR
ncbi:MAG: hypothetical protein F6K41_23820, partial [Symploca sp. SIO3E6]|nr:hypothetical protein [Caldora sp. SIO3E6]